MTDLPVLRFCPCGRAASSTFGYRRCCSWCQIIPDRQGAHTHWCDVRQRGKKAQRMTPEQIMSHILPTRKGEVAAFCGRGQEPVRLKVADGPWHTRPELSIVYLEDEAGSRFRVEVKQM